MLYTRYQGRDSYSILNYNHLLYIPISLAPYIVELWPCIIYKCSL